MIKVDRHKRGLSISIKSEGVIDLIEELSAVIEAVKNKFHEEGLPDEVSDRLITFAGQMAYADNEEDILRETKELSSWLDEDIKGRENGF